MPKAGSAERKPSVAYLGYLSSIEKAKVSSSGNYAMMNFQVANAGSAGSKGSRGRLLFRPEWFSPNFVADRDLAEKGQKFVFDSNIASREDVSVLQAFCGTKAKYDEMDNGAYALGEYTVDSVGDYLYDFITNLGHVPFGYILRQQQEKTGVMGDNGRELKTYTQFMELDRFFLVQDAKDQAISKRILKGKLDYANKKAAEASEASGYPVEPLFRVAFDLDVLG